MSDISAQRHSLHQTANLSNEWMQDRIYRTTTALLLTAVNAPVCAAGIVVFVAVRDDLPAWVWVPFTTAFSAFFALFVLLHVVLRLQRRNLRAMGRYTKERIALADAELDEIEGKDWRIDG